MLLDHSFPNRLLVMLLRMLYFSFNLLLKIIPPSIPPSISQEDKHRKEISSETIKELLKGERDLAVEEFENFIVKYEIYYTKRVEYREDTEALLDELDLNSEDIEMFQVFAEKRIDGETLRKIKNVIYNLNIKLDEEAFTKLLDYFSIVPVKISTNAQTKYISAFAIYVI